MHWRAANREPGPTIAKIWAVLLASLCMIVILAVVLT